MQEPLSSVLSPAQPPGTDANIGKQVRCIIENDMLNGEVIRLDGAIRLAPKWWGGGCKVPSEEHRGCDNTPSPKAKKPPGNFRAAFFLVHADSMSY